MIVAVDSYYSGNTAKTALITFKNWEDAEYLDSYIDKTEIPSNYISGEFYKRELPLIITILKRIEIKSVDTIIIDGFVYLNDSGKLGLGGYLFEYFNQKIPVIGVAKSDYIQNKSNKTLIYRGKSKHPLYISAAGISMEEAVNFIQNMHGKYRIPKLLKDLDRLTKQ